MTAAQYLAFANTGISIIVITIFIFAFLRAEANMKIILAAILALLFFLPRIIHGPAIFWICYVGKIIFGIGCYLYFKASRY